MNKKRTIVMLTILLVTVLSASSFYMIEKGINPLSIFVNSYAAEPSGNDFEKVYGDKNAPYDDNDGKGSYFIRYTGKQTKSTTVDLTKENESISIDANGYPVILGTTITNTYKMFTKSSSLTTYVDVEKVFIPDSIAIKAEEDNTITDGCKGIQQNTFTGCKQEIALIYGTGEISGKDARGTVLTSTYDKTGKITNRDNVVIYVKLDDQNIADRTDVDAVSNTYKGNIKNVYVSSEVKNIVYFFNRANSASEINNVLLDEKGTWTSLNRMCSIQREMKKISSYFKIPNTVTDIRYMFQNIGISEIPDTFVIPESVTDVDDLFAWCTKLRKVPNSFKLPDNLEIAQGLFYNCGANLIEFPEEFVIPEKVTNASSMFTNDTNLSTTVIIKSRNVELIKDRAYPSNPNLYPLFTNAGTASKLEPLPNYKTPIVMKCYADSTAISYTENVYSANNPDGKVTKIIMSDEWEKVYEKDASYKDDDGNSYYIHYIGRETDKEASVDVDLTDTSKYSRDANGYPIVLDTSITSTYKMFEYNDKVAKVFIPDSIAIKAEEDSSITDGYKGIQQNTFTGCEQEIALIYETGEISGKDARGTVLTSAYDKTNKITNQDNVAIYVKLDSSNIGDRTNVVEGNYTYKGNIKNVYVNSEVKYIVSFFNRTSGANEINNILLDEKGTWTSLNRLCANQRGIKKISSYFKIPNTVTDIGYMFQLIGISEIPDTFVIPESVTDVDDLFAWCTNLKKVSNSFKLPNNLEIAQGLFYNCGAYLKEFPEEFVIPEKVTNASAMFTNDTNLSTTVIIKSRNAELIKDKSYPTSLYPLFTNAGTASELEPLSNYKTPIVMKCYADSTAASYTENVYSDNNPDGKVTKIIMNDEWEKIYEEDAPYKDADGNSYYIHYIGKETDKEASVDVDLTDTSKYSRDVNGYPIVLDTLITSTYKMFDYNDKVAKVFIPDSIAIKAEKDSSITDGCKGIQQNTFTGCEQEIALIYETGEISGKDARGTVLTSAYDKTDKITNQDNVVIYVKLDDSNVADRVSVAIASNTYKGSIKNVYVSSEVKSIGYFFNGTSGANEINNILLDEKGTWTSLNRLCANQHGIKKISSYFKIPNTVTDIQYMFNITQIEEIPDTFKIPDNVTNADDLFAWCTNLKKVSNNFKLPDNLEIAQGLFYNCGVNLKEFPKEFVIPEKVTNASAMFTNDTNLSTTVIIKSKNAELVKEYNRPSNLYPIFQGAGTAQGLANLSGYKTPIAMKCYSDSLAASYTDSVYSKDNPDGKVTKEYIDQTSSMIQKSEAVINIDDNEMNDASSDVASKNDTDTLIDSNINQDTFNDSNESIVIEDETDWVTITVTKKTVDETVAETQTNSQSTETVTGKTKEEDEVQE